MFHQSLKDQDLRNSNEIKLIKASIDQVEAHFGHICSCFSSLAAKIALVRDSGDDLSRKLKEYATVETLNKSMRTNLSAFADCLISIEDYRQTMVDRVEAKVIGHISPYKQICKSAKDNVKTAVRANDKKLEKQRNLQKLRNKLPINRQEIAESELTQAKVEAGEKMKDMTDSMQKFQHKKLKDVKEVLLNYTKTEMIFHAKALELYTQAFNNMSNINEDDDLQEWCNGMNLSGPQWLSSKEISNSRNTLKSIDSFNNDSTYDENEDVKTGTDDENSEESSYSTIQ